LSSRVAAYRNGVSKDICFDTQPRYGPAGLFGRYSARTDTSNVIPPLERGDRSLREAIWGAVERVG